MLTVVQLWCNHDRQYSSPMPLESLHVQVLLVTPPALDDAEVYSWSLACGGSYTFHAPSMAKVQLDESPANNTDKI